ncbi:MAG: hypothetical protein M1837_002578 [Sclerophora amabilis]|nr:MAG: hypothetical protein M1837_002578 [Sclerophora amabilis]
MSTLTFAPSDVREEPGSSGLTAKKLADYHQSRYRFREKLQAQNRSITTWLDQDDSGNFDPSAKKALPRPKRKREQGPREFGPESDAESYPRKSKALTWKLGRRTGLSLITSIALNSDRGRALLKSLADSSLAKDISEDCSKEKWPEPGISLPDGNTSQVMNLPRLTRSLFKPAQFDDAPCTNLETTRLGLQRPRESEQWRTLMKGTEGRGCKACLELGIRCPLLEDDSEYPCLHCVEDECDCELIAPPAKKRACESCRKIRTRCSYRSGGDHSLPCERCRNKDIVCCAGPEKPAIERTDDNNSTTFVPTSERMFLACTPCRRAKRWCTLSNKKNRPPCGSCAREPTDCTFEKLERGKKVSDQNASEQNLPPSPLNEVCTTIADKGNSSSEGRNQSVIATRYAHPIVFNHDTSQSGSKPCHWCSEVSYGIAGLGEALEAEVVNWPDQSGYVEISGGYTGRGHEPSRMCVACTMDRLCIASCSAHTIQPVKDLNADDFDFEAAFDELVLDSEAQPDRSPTLWCCICPSPAFFECCTPQQNDDLGDSDDLKEPLPLGCGLVLCEGCAALLSGEYGGDLLEMISAVNRDEEDFPLGVRADVGFLGREGELVKRFLGSS